MNEIFNSTEFRDSVSKLTFSQKNIWKNKQLITGKEVLEQLDKHKNDKWKLIMKESSGALGVTNLGSDSTTAFLDNIKRDMCKLTDPCKFPFQYALAVNLCHEYMHHLGYRHVKDPKDKTLRLPNPKNCQDMYYDPKMYPIDIAYRVGWITFDIFVEQLVKND